MRPSPVRCGLSGLPLISAALLTIIVSLMLHPATSSIPTTPTTDTTQQKLLVVSFDAFKPVYLDFGITPHLQAIIDAGVHSPFMRSTFPTKTFPNHFSLATGLYAGVHGVVGSVVLDRRHNRTLRYGHELFHQHDDWVRPIWTANELMGGHSGCMMWPGGEFSYADVSSTYTTAYNHTVEWRVKVDTVMQWLSSPAMPANLVMLYFDEPDYMGHVFAPASNETLDMIRRTDETVAYLQTQLAHYKLTNTTNILFVSDHGMTDVGSPQFINLTALLAPNTAAMYGGSPVVQVVPHADIYYFDVLTRLRRGAMASRHYNVYTVAQLPQRWHLLHADNIDRLGPIVVVADEGWAFEDMYDTAAYYERTFNVTRSPTRRYGIHGYDNADGEMHATFVATGPAFRPKAARIEGFDNVELFGLMWRLLGYPADRMPPTNVTVAGLMRWDAVLKAEDFDDGVRRKMKRVRPLNWRKLGVEFLVVLVLAVPTYLLIHAARLACCAFIARRRQIAARRRISQRQQIEKVLLL